MLSQERIASVLNGMKDRVSDPNTMNTIREGFEGAFVQVKDRLGDSWQDVRSIYDMVIDNEFTVGTKYKVAMIGALLYLVSPVDIISEKHFGALGLADDIAVLLFAVNFAKPEIARYAEFKAGNLLAATPIEEAEETEGTNAEA